MNLWDRFADHIERDLAAGGPDPHMRCVGWMMRGESQPEKLWRIGCYVGVYNVPAAEIIWQNWPWERIRDESEAFPSWLEEHWKGLTLRRERRAVRTPKKLTRYFLSYASLALRLPLILQFLPADPHEAYRVLWKEVDQGVYGAGRYAISKIMECYQRYCEAPIDTPDILPRDGWSPRLTLLHLLEKPEIDPYSNLPAALAASNFAAEAAQERLSTQYGLPLDIFRLEVFLCDFRQSYEGGRQYPGRSNDSEISYHDKIKTYWGYAYHTKMYEARAALMPPECRGEVSGWNEPREELFGSVKRHGYVWSDLLFDYHATEDFANPVERGNGAIEVVRNLARQALSTR